MSSALLDEPRTNNSTAQSPALDLRANMAAVRELKVLASGRLCRLFNPSDYPETLVVLFDVSLDFPSVEPPDYLRDLNPALYEAERARVAARFDEAVQLAERAFLDEFSKLVSHLTERISGVGENGEKKTFRDSAIGNLSEFFERFRSLNVRN